MRGFALAPALLAVGCAQVAPSAPPQAAKPLPPLKITCPLVDIFSPADKTAIAAMLEPFPNGSPQVRMGLEWYRLHADAEACAIAARAPAK